MGEIKAQDSDLQISDYKFVGGHRFARIAKVSTLGLGKHLYYSVKCVNCGITGKREDLQSPVERSKEYADERYDSCAMAYILEQIRTTSLSFNQKLDPKQIDEIVDYLMGNPEEIKREYITNICNVMLK